MEPELGSIQGVLEMNSVQNSFYNFYDDSKLS